MHSKVDYFVKCGHACICLFDVGMMVAGDLFSKGYRVGLAQKMPKLVTEETPLSPPSFCFCLGKGNFVILHPLSSVSAEMKSAGVFQKRSPAPELVPPKPQENNPMWSPKLYYFQREVRVFQPPSSSSPPPPPRPKSNKNKKVVTLFKKYQGLTPPGV